MVVPRQAHVNCYAIAMLLVPSLYYHTYSTYIQLYCDNIRRCSRLEGWVNKYLLCRASRVSKIHFCSLENWIKWEIYCCKASNNAASNHLELRHFALNLQVWKSLLYFKFQHSNFGYPCILALRWAVQSLDKIEDIKILTFFVYIF